jgi:hypothetical protein
MYLYKALEVAVEYADRAPDDRPTKPIPVRIVRQPREPLVFTAHFHAWDTNSTRQKEATVPPGRCTATRHARHAHEIANRHSLVGIVGGATAVQRRVGGRSREARPLRSNVCPASRLRLRDVCRVGGDGGAVVVSRFLFRYTYEELSTKNYPHGLDTANLEVRACAWPLVG